MNYTLVIAVIGCVTGIAGLLLQWRSHILTAARLKVEVDTYANSYYLKDDRLEIPNYRTNCCAVVSLKISNTSAYPVTIDSVFVPGKGGAYRHNNMFRMPAPPIPFGDKGGYTEYRPSDPLSIPIRLEPFDTVFASVRLPFFGSLVPEGHKGPVDVKICLSTPRKLYTCRAKIHEYADLHRNRLARQQ